MNTLVYIGANTGVSLYGFFDKYDQVYAFEPDPEMFRQLKTRLAQFEWVTLVNAACSTENGKTTFYVTNNTVSSSLGTPSDEFAKKLDSVGGDGAPVVKEIEVETINLGEYLKEQGVEFIDLYISDCQGSDLNVLKTMKEYIDNDNIGELYIETHGDNTQIYNGLDNQYSGFKNLLNDNFDFIHATLGSYGAGNASPERVQYDGQIVDEEYILDVSGWNVSNPEWDTYWRSKTYEPSIGQSLRS
jgi:FkbM family methyltransferase